MKFDLSLPTVKENKSYYWYNNSCEGKNEEEADRQSSQGAEQQQCESQEGTGLEVLSEPGLHQLRYLWEKPNNSAGWKTDPSEENNKNTGKTMTDEIFV